MYHLALDFQLHIYALRSWSAKSTPLMSQLYSLTAIGQEKSEELPLGSLRDTTLGSQIVSTKATGFLSLHTKQWTELFITCFSKCYPLAKDFM